MEFNESYGFLCFVVQITAAIGFVLINHGNDFDAKKRKEKRTRC